MTDLNETKSRDEMKILNASKIFKNKRGEFSKSKRDLALRKGIAPFDHMTHKEYLLRETLPPKQHFRSLLSLEDVTEVDYLHAQNFYKEYSCQNLLKYLRLYCHVS